MKLPLSYLPNIRFLSWCCLSAGMMAPAALLAAPNPAEIRMQQDIQQRQREEQLRQTMQPETDVRLNGGRFNESVSQSIGDADDQPCFAINEVILEGEHHARFQFALKRALRETGFQAGKCLNAGDINHIMTVAQNILIGRGYTTTRILAAPQDLNSGKLVLTVLAGYLKNIEVDMSQANQTHAGRIAAFQNEFPTRSDGILNLRDLEQGLENLKRIPTAEADIQIVPVDGVPNQSTVLVKWQQRLLPYRLSVGIDDSGTKATGKYQGNITFSADNPLGLSDLFYVNYGRSIGNVPDAADSSGSLKKGGTHNYALHYSVPFGKWTWAFNHSGYRYHQAVAGLSAAYDYNGKSYNTDLGFNRLIYRDAKRKTHVGAKLWTRETQSYIDDAEITVQRRRTAGWLTELSHKEYIGNSTAQFKIAYKRGTGMSDALRAPEELFGEGTSRMKIWTANADVNIPFQIGKQSFAYDTTIQAQWNKTPLTPQDKIAIGGRYTVRGFDGEMSLAAERGWYWRNDLSWRFKQGHQLYVGADVGHVSGQSAKWLLGQTLAGATIGVRGQMKVGGNLHYDLFASRAVKKPEYFQTKKWVTGFQVGYSF
ncbi:ShlB/FhaC/HecB family hemolysin secretion/activation protein [Suttonella indologenes]|uniref:Hemolysin transporter protein shlB n=1 Tax=Suttonella indologenes TaxID=13276 RepID=A0A380MJA3_9GAMM|nr:ShlB/FhaC/HecB family hemolysin secretion/activation protein [Suttonella indologenes]SUO92471.1 Hemolysin transporter protein shlB precursor [Suttonella indologenes]